MPEDGAIILDEETGARLISSHGGHYRHRDDSHECCGCVLGFECNGCNGEAADAYELVVSGSQPCLCDSLGYVEHQYLQSIDGMYLLEQTTEDTSIGRCVWRSEPFTRDLEGYQWVLPGPYGDGCESIGVVGEQLLRWKLRWYYFSGLSPTVYHELALQWFIPGYSGAEGNWANFCGCTQQWPLGTTPPCVWKDIYTFPGCAFCGICHTAVMLTSGEYTYLAGPSGLLTVTLACRRGG